MNFALLALTLLFSLPSFAAPSPLFGKGTESFEILNLKSETPVIRILDGSVMKRSFSLVANSVLGFAKNTNEPKPYVNLRLEKLFLEPTPKDPEKINIRLQISGKEFDLEPTLSKTDLMSGKDIMVHIPTDTQQLALFTVSTRGQFKVRYNPAQSTLFIQQAVAEIDLENPLSAKESERVDFTGKAIRIGALKN